MEPSEKLKFSKSIDCLVCDSLLLFRQVVAIARLNSSTSLTELIYYGLRNGQPVRAISLVNMLLGYEIQQLAVALDQVVRIMAEGEYDH